MFGINLFDITRYTETTTIAWLRIISLVITAVGVYLMYYSRTLSPPSTVLMIAGAAVAMLG